MWQLAQQGAQGGHPSVAWVHFSEGHSSAALHVAAVLFTSLWKPITPPQCCASRSRYISHTRTNAQPGMHLHRCTPPHTHTHRDKHLQQLLLPAAAEDTDNAFWPVSGEIYIDVRSRNDYLQLRRIRRQVSDCMKNDSLFTVGFYTGPNARWL